jgi:HD superfamily phosphohydrolase YqeK
MLLKRIVDSKVSKDCHETVRSAQEGEKQLAGIILSMLKEHDEQTSQEAVAKLEEELKALKFHHKMAHHSKSGRAD